MVQHCPLRSYAAVYIVLHMVSLPVFHTRFHMVQPLYHCPAPPADSSCAHWACVTPQKMTWHRGTTFLSRTMQPCSWCRETAIIEMDTFSGRTRPRPHMVQHMVQPLSLFCTWSTTWSSTWSLPCRPAARGPTRGPKHGPAPVTLPHAVQRMVQNMVHHLSHHRQRTMYKAM